jgi:hypothetical protein
MDKAFKEWCDKIGISPKSHDYSIAKAAWQEAVRVTVNAVKQVATKEKK